MLAISCWLTWGLKCVSILSESHWRELIFSCRYYKWKVASGLGEAACVHFPSLGLGPHLPWTCPCPMQCCRSLVSSYVHQPCVYGRPCFLGVLQLHWLSLSTCSLWTLRGRFDEGVLLDWAVKTLEISNWLPLCGLFFLVFGFAFGVCVVCCMMCYGCVGIPPCTCGIQKTNLWSQVSPVSIGSGHWAWAVRAEALRKLQFFSFIWVVSSFPHTSP